MRKVIEKALTYTFYVLFFLLPLILVPITSEIFEFNKIILVYIAVSIIAFLWVAKMIDRKKFVFRRTILDIPLIVFLVSQILTTIISIDRITSIFGYYSRFNGGLLSIFSFIILYFAYNANMTAKRTKKCILFLISSLCLVSVYGVLEHFGIDKNLWVQDVQNRVFSTLGQPNWLAAVLTAVIPLTWALSLESGIKNQKSKISITKIKWFFLSSLFFLTLLYTKSRSGLIGFLVADLFFWLLTIITSLNEKDLKKVVLKSFLILNSLFLILISVIGSPWTPSLFQISNLKKGSPADSPRAEAVDLSKAGPALEVGGTASSEIRKIVWKGALNIFKANPFLGSGVETFAYSYFLYRPVEHNLVSEWDYLYNKAHNEYLNYLATTGGVGLTSYLILIAASIYIFLRSLSTKHEVRNSKQSQNLNFKNSKKFGVLNFSNWNLFSASDFEFRILEIALLSGYVSILVTNFFGFSVVVVSLLFFLFPAMAISLVNTKSLGLTEYSKLDIKQKFLLFFALCTTAYVLYRIGTYWYADVLYAQGKNLNKSTQYPQARISLLRSRKLIPFQAIYWDELSQSAVGLAVDYYQTGSFDEAKIFSETAITESNYALRLSPRNLNLRKNNAALFIKLANLDPKLLIKAEELIKATIAYSPTDAKLYYNLGLVQARLDKINEAISTLENTVKLKTNYRDARFALAILYNRKGLKTKAKDQLNYILESINPQDELVKQQLQEI